MIYLQHYFIAPYHFVTRHYCCMVFWTSYFKWAIIGLYSEEELFQPIACHFHSKEVTEVVLSESILLFFCLITRTLVVNCTLSAHKTVDTKWLSLLTMDTTDNKDILTRSWFFRVSSNMLHSRKAYPFEILSNIESV